MEKPQQPRNIAFKTEQEEPLASTKHDGRHLVIVAFSGAGAGLTGVALLAARDGTWATFSWIASSGLALAAASALTGMLLGFLFGIPRTGVWDDGAGGGNGAAGRSGQPGDAGRAESSPAPPRRTAGYTPNTGLEQVSDWLTKILVGVGLTQLMTIRGALAALSDRLTKENLPGAFFVALMIYFAAIGFLVGYVWTRVVLSPMFKRADFRLRETEKQAEVVQKTLHEAERKLDDVEKIAQTIEQTNDGIVRMISGLYDVKNEGFRSTLEEGKAILQKSGDPKTFRFWLYLAAAQGQRADNIGKESPEFQDARTEALIAIRKTLEYDTDDSTGKTLLKDLLQGTIPEENDLVVFKDDPEFRRLLGMT